MDVVLPLLALDLTFDVEVVAYVHAVLALLGTLAWSLSRAAVPLRVGDLLAPLTSSGSRHERGVPGAAPDASLGRAPPARA